MSGTALAIGAGVSALGAGVSAYAQNQQLRKQDNIAAQGIINQGALRQQANSDVQKLIKNTGENNAANIARNQTTQEQEYAAALQRAAPTQGGALTTQPGASKAYAAAVNSARGNVAQFGSDLGKSTAATDAPQLTQIQTQEALGDTATKLGLLNDTSANQNRLMQIQASAVQANPWLQAGGGILQGAGTGYAARKMGAPPATAAATPYSVGTV